ncbi:hypothetical protein GJ654_18340 [Rhodoblastus acidophilus]|uniref:Uncharacterized protein n=2 Tax=Rhodoblastus acidophilus TaxID=1074 RepID=A0A6N8DUT5_RHOAC|nr:hypothetical protein [Rhodoblastus acidophilus]MCW2276281.1 hypothetical protein [Rhodoblastus acidophilus]MTV32943.1 hypothetical protein [Rhodoblastus acidophilus]
MPVRVKKMRQNKNLELFHVSMKRGKALERPRPKKENKGPISDRYVAWAPFKQYGLGAHAVQWQAAAALPKWMR